MSGGDDDSERAITVQIVAASATVRAGLAALVGADEHFVVSGSHADAADAAQEFDAASERLPDVLIVELGDVSGEELTELTNYREEADIHPPAIIVLVPDSQLESVVELLRAGVRAVLPRSASGGEIVAAIGAASAGLTVVHSEAARVTVGIGFARRRFTNCAAAGHAPGAEHGRADAARDRSARHAGGRAG